MAPDMSSMDTRASLLAMSFWAYTNRKLSFTEKMGRKTFSAWPEILVNKHTHGHLDRFEDLFGHFVKQAAFEQFFLAGNGFDPVFRG